MMTAIKFAKTRPDAIIPTREEGNAGFDIYACFDENNLVINPLETKLIPTGIASACDNGFYFQAEERGSTGSKGIKKSAGVIDSSYRGEIFIAITNCHSKPLLISKETDTSALTDDYIVYPYSKAIAQLILHEVINTDVEEYTYEELKTIPSNRGCGMLGSTGK